MIEKHTAADYRHLVEALNDLSSFTWKAVNDKNSNVNLIADDDLSLWVHEGGYGNEGRIRFSYDRPRHRNGDYVSVWEKHSQVSDPGISVSVGREPSAVAKDILRRLVPEARRVHALVKAQIASYETHFDKVRKLAIDAANVASAKLPEFKDGQTPSFRLFEGYGDYSFGYGTVKVNSETLDIDLHSLPASLGKEVLKLLRMAVASHIADVNASRPNAEDNE